MKPITVLVMSAGSIPGFAILNALKEQTEMPVRLVAADMAALSAGFQIADARAVVPAGSHPDFIPAIRELCRREGVEVVFPVIDEELQVFADHAAALAQDGIRVITNSPDVVRVAKDKWLTYQRAMELGVRVPLTLRPDDLRTRLLPAFPLVLKPRAGRGAVGVQVVRNPREYEFYREEAPESLVQQWIDGDEFTIDVLTDFDGRLLSVVAKHRLMVKSGMQTKGRTVNDPALMEFGRDITAEFGLAPRANVQCIRDREGRIWLVEINPKFPASLPFTVAAGVNAPLLLLKLHRHETVAPFVGQFEAGLVMLRVWREFYTRESTG